MFKITFLNPFYLFFLILISIPVILHLFYGRKEKKIYFSSLKFFDELLLRRKYLAKLKEPLLLVFRCSLLALLSLLLARPVLKSNISGIKDKIGNTSYVILQDNSVSMNYREKNTTRKYLQEQQILKLINFFDNTCDGVVIFAPDYKPIDVEKYSPPSTSPSFDIESALVVSGEYLKSAHSKTKEIYIFTDAQKNNFEKINRHTIEDTIPKDVNIYFFDFGKKLDKNIFISDVKVEKFLITNTPFKIKVEISNYNLSSPEDISVSLYIEEKLQNEKRVSVVPGRKSEVWFDYIFRESGNYAGYIEISNDALNEDNKYFINFNVKDTLNVLCVGETTDDTFYLKYALSPFWPKKTKGILPVVITLPDLEKIDLSYFDVIILSNIEELSSLSAAKIYKHLKDGKGIIIFTGENINTNFYKKFLKIEIGMLQTKNLPLFLTSFNMKNELFEIFRNPQEFDLSGIRFLKYYNLFCRENCFTLAKFDYKVPAILEIRKGNGKILFFNTTSTPDFSNLCLSPIFLPLIHSAVFYLSTKSNEVKSYAKTPSLSCCGNFSITDMSGVKKIISLNYTRDESELSRVEKKKLLSIFGKKLKYFQIHQISLDKIKRAGIKDLRGLLIYVLFVILLAEVLILLI